MSDRYDVADNIIAFEMGELGANETLVLFAHLIETGLAWELQGSYGRNAKRLIEQGLITPRGEVTDAYLDREDEE